MKILNDNALFEQYANALKAQDVFSFWGQYEAALLRFEKGEYISLYDQKQGQLCFVAAGTGKVTYITEGGREIFVATILPGTLLGDMEFAGVASALNIIAITEMDCICIPIGKNRKLLDGDVKFLWTIINGLVMKSQSNLRLTYSGKNFSIEAKIASFAMTSVDHGVLRPSWTAVAELLHVSYRQLMRVLRTFCSMGVLERGEKLGEYRILDPRRLEELAGEVYSV